MYLDNVRKTGVSTNKKFWELIKPFVTNRVFVKNAKITLGEKDETEQREVVKILMTTS